MIEPRFVSTRTGYVEEIRTPSVIRRRILTAGEWTEERITCFCCSCPDSGPLDPYCRNDGWWGQRPCELHGMPGKVDEDGNMPVSVQEYRHRIEVKH